MLYKLINTSIHKIDFDNELQSDGTIMLSANYDLDVTVNPENSQQVIAIAFFDLNGTSENNESSFLSMNLICSGVFEADSDVGDSDIKVENLRTELFPYIRAYVSTITALSGLQPITLPDLSVVSE